MNPIDFLDSRVSPLSLDDYEIFHIEKHVFSAEAKEGEIDSLEEAREHGLSIRLFKDGKCGFGCTSDLNPEFIQKMLDQAIQGLSLVEAESDQRLSLPAEKPAFKSKKSQTFLSRGDKLQLALALERAAKEFDPRIRRVRSASINEENKKIQMRNSQGLDVEDQVTGYDISLMLTAEDGGGQEMAWDSRYGLSLGLSDVEQLARQTAEKAIFQLGAKPISTCKAPVVLDPMVATSFLGVLSSSFLADQVQRNRSALRGRLGESIYSQNVTMVDDGGLEGGAGTFAFDGEGVATERHEVVGQGVLKQFLYDLRSAARDKKQSTGNGIRPQFKEPPRVGVSNFFIQAGHESLGEMLSEMGTGLWIRDVIGVHTADAVTGDFSLGASGLWIENGKRQKPVRGITISGNLHNMFHQVRRVGGEIRFYNNYGSPPLLVESLDIGGL